ncbi:MAG TPA: glycosyltransferase family 4 protein [Candidatus Paceibacterota bacterium]|jgi:Glycosyltransferase
MSRRILIFSLAYYPKHVGGAEVAIKEITDRNPDIEFDMLTAKLVSGLSSFERIGNVNVHRLGMGSSVDKILFPMIGTWKAILLHRTRHYDLFWAMMVTFSSGVPYIMNILRRVVGLPKVPVILTLQEGDSREHIRRKRFGLIGLSWKCALLRTDLVTVISRYLEGEARAYGYHGPVALVPNGVDVAAFTKPSGFARIEVRKELGFSESDRVIVTASRLVLKNAVGDLVEALTYMPEDVKLLVIGSGELEDSLKKSAAYFGVASRVVFKGFVPHKDLPRYLHACDVFVRASLSEGFGNSFVEAMAAGVPVVATPVGGIVDFLRDKETGLFCEPGKPEDIARKIEIYLHDRILRDEIVENARVMVLARYDWNLVAKDMRVKAFDILKP